MVAAFRVLSILIALAALSAGAKNYQADIEDYLEELHYEQGEEQTVDDASKHRAQSPILSDITTAVKVSWTIKAICCHYKNCFQIIWLNIGVVFLSIINQ